MKKCSSCNKQIPCACIVQIARKENKNNFTYETDEYDKYKV